MLIREAKSGDRAEVLAFFTSAHGEDPPTRTIDRIIQFGCCLLAESFGRIVGYVTLEYTFFDRGFVSMLFVQPSHRRSGVARKLMQAAAARCRTDVLFTSTNESNEPMQALLSQLGYIPAGSFDHLNPHDPELFFVRTNQNGGA